VGHCCPKPENTTQYGTTCPLGDPVTELGCRIEIINPETQCLTQNGGYCIKWLYEMNFTK